MEDVKMNCDNCKGTDFKEVFILRKEKFSRSATKSQKKYSRICWNCARTFFKQKIYNFGYNWRCIFLDNSVITEKNKAKYMVVHT